MIEGWQPRPGENIAIDNNKVGPGYHELMGIPLVQGRGFTEQDNANAPRVAIINEAMARAYFPNQNPLAKRFSLGQGRAMAGDHRRDARPPLAQPDRNADSAFRLPALQDPYGSSARLVVRTKLDPLAVLPAVRKEALALNRASGDRTANDALR